MLGFAFYAGWGLTRDRESCSRRGRFLELDALVHAALIEYPRYVSRGSGWFITPEQAIDELIAWKDAPPPTPHLGAGTISPLGSAPPSLGHARISF